MSSLVATTFQGMMTYRGSNLCSDQPQSEAQRPQAAIEEALRSSRVAESALQHSRRVGDLLLKNEDEEVQRITEYAEELLNTEYRCVAA
jgi:hypothetical protein